MSFEARSARSEARARGEREGGKGGDQPFIVRYPISANARTVTPLQGLGVPRYLSNELVPLVLGQFNRMQSPSFDIRQRLAPLSVLMQTFSLGLVGYYWARVVPSPWWMPPDSARR